MTRVVQPSLGPRVFVAHDGEDARVPTLMFRRTKSRPPLSLAERTPFHFTRGDRSVEAWELEVRGILAARYAETSPHAAARHGLATQYLEARVPAEKKAHLLEAFDRQNAEELEASRLEYELDQLDLDEETRRVVRAEVRS